ncbi:MAG TPA: ribbon-helix-helix protein, CopG family, partial [Polyangiaceae bacterium]
MRRSAPVRARRGGRETFRKPRGRAFVTSAARDARIPTMSERLVRFGVAMEASLLEEFDKVVEGQGTTRSEALRDLARAAVVRANL